MQKRPIATLLILALGWAPALAQDPSVVLRERFASLPELGEMRIARTDWLLRREAFPARVGRTERTLEIALDNGLVRRTFRIAPNGATVGLDDLVRGNALLRSVRPEARVTVDGVAWDVGGLVGQQNHAFLRPRELDALGADPQALQLVDFAVGVPEERFAWKRVRHHAPDVHWPPRGVSLRFDYAFPPGSADGARRAPLDVRVSVHYELYDGIPAFSKWMTVTNRGERSVRVDRFTLEELAVVEHANWVETRDGVTVPRPESLQVETDFAFGGFEPENANRHVVHWRADPLYATQVNYLRQTPCLLVVAPTYGPAQAVDPGETFETFRAFELVHDSTERERRGLAYRRLYRTIAPWVTENPLMHHLRTADPGAVERAIDQAAEVGFEMIILSFGSGFDVENDDPAHVERWRRMAERARARGIELGGYSLLSSRAIGGGNDIVSPAGSRPTHGNCPALTSPWGQAYYRKLTRFFEQTGFAVLEHDGPYPGDVDVTPRPPLQEGEQDSRWAQWRIAAGFYRWCRERGIYVNAPDYYYLNGTSKCGMGYRETNWSLPRDQQVLHTRQNVYDGTWIKTPSMGWMFVPLSEYHGGGAAATIEPLDEHRDHYERMLASNLGLGVQACYRGPRLFDGERTRDLLRRWVDWFRRYRTILEADAVHGRRADGRDVDWMLHVDPRGEVRGLLVVYNPLEHDVVRTLRVNLYYTGLDDRAHLAHEDGDPHLVTIPRDHVVDVEVRVPAAGMTWFTLRP